MNHKASTYLLFVLIAVLALWIFVPSFSYDYLILYDDGPLILENKAVLAKSWARIQVAFSEFVYGLYHPLTSLSFAYNYDWFDSSARSMHIINFLVHLLNGLLVYLLLQHFLKERLFSLLGCALFLVHPLHLESVVWLSERKDLLYTFFLLLAFLSYLRWRLKSDTKWFVFTILLFLASLLSKSAAVVFPLLILSYLFLWERKRAFKDYFHTLVLFVLSFVFGIINLLAQSEAGFIRELQEFSFIDRFFLLSYSFDYYILSFVWPFFASPKHFYPKLNDGLLSWEFYASFLLLISIAFICARVWKHHQKKLLGLFLFALAILPVLKIIPTGNDLVSDRYTYLPYFGLILFFFAFLQDAVKTQKHKNFAILGLSIVVLSFSFFSKNYQMVWETEERIWTKVLRDNPNHSVPYTERGRFYIVHSEYERALFDLNKAIEIDDKNSLAWNNRASAFAGLGRVQEAVEDFDRAIELDPDYAFAYSNRGIELFKMGFADKAMEDFNRAIDLEPENAGHYNNKGIALAQGGDLAGAVTLFKKALELSPGHSDARLNYNRAISLLSKEKPIE